jgi:hypothetical protein
MKKSAWVVCLLMLLLGRLQSGGQVNVTTWHNDNWRTGENTNEIILKKSSFNNNGFGLLCKISLPSSPQQEQVYAQPLVVTNNDGSMNVYVATMQDNVYAFNVPNTRTSLSLCVSRHYRFCTATIGALDSSLESGGCAAASGMCQCRNFRNPREYRRRQEQGFAVQYRVPRVPGS